MKILSQYRSGLIYEDEEHCFVARRSFNRCYFVARYGKVMFEVHEIDIALGIAEQLRRHIVNEHY